MLSPQPYQLARSPLAALRTPLETMPAPRVAQLLLQRNAAHVARFDRTKAKPLGLALKTAVVTCPF